MRHFILAAFILTCQAPPLAAQRVPGRDLLLFPLATVDRSAALTGGIGDGLGNPAAIVLDDGERARLGIASLQTSREQGVAIYMAAAALDLPEKFTVGISAAHATVNDLYRTELDPSAIGNEIEYNTTVVSAAIARRNGGRVVTGLAVRYRTGVLDEQRDGAFGIDGGVLVEHLTRLDASVGVATFLWRPGDDEEERTSLNVAGDLRVLGVERGGVRAGYGLTITEGNARDHFGYAVGRYGRWEALAGALLSEAFGTASWRSRLGVRVHHGEYVVGVARESGADGFSATYQFMISMVLRDRHAESARPDTR
jgi:hypothetical protein